MYGVLPDTITDRAVGPCQTYTYRVKALNGKGASAFSASASVTIPAVRGDCKPTIEFGWWTQTSTALTITLPTSDKLGVNIYLRVRESDSDEWRRTWTETTTTNTWSGTISGLEAGKEWVLGVSLYNDFREQGSRRYRFRTRPASPPEQQSLTPQRSEPQLSNDSPVVHFKTDSFKSELKAGTAEPVNSAATGKPTISGTAQVGRNADGGDGGDRGRRRSGRRPSTATSGWRAARRSPDATASSYTLTEDEQGQTVEVRVSFTDDAGNEETLTSDPTEVVAARPNRLATGKPTISGTAQVGETLTAATTGIEDDDGLDEAVYRYQWLAGGAPIPGATVSSYTLTGDEQGQTIEVRVSFTDDAGNEETLTSDPTDAVAARPNRLATGKPTISGTAQVGETLTAATAGIEDDDGLDSVSYRYQWLAGGAPIPGATVSSYTLTGDEQGQTDRGPGLVHGRRRQRGDLDQRSDGCGGGQAQPSRDGQADDLGHGASRRDADRGDRGDRG